MILFRFKNQLGIHIKKKQECKKGMTCAAFLLSFNVCSSLERLKRASFGPGLLQCPFAGLPMLLKPGLSSALGCCSDATNHPASTSFSQSHQIVQPGTNPAPQRLWGCPTWSWRTPVWSPWGSPALPEVTLGTQPRCCCLLQASVLSLAPTTPLCVSQVGNLAQNQPEAAL